MESMINIEGISRSKEDAILLASVCQAITHIMESEQEQKTIRVALRTLAKIVKLPNDQRTITISDSTFTSNPEPKDEPSFSMGIVAGTDQQAKPKAEPTQEKL